MADSPLNNSWPSFSKFWMKRWSFKKECKQCSQEFPRGQERSLPACVNIDNRSNSLSEVEEMYFNRMAEGKDDPFLDYDDSATDATSSTEDIPSLDSSVQLSSMTLRDPRLSRCPVTSSSEDVTRVDTVSGCPGQLGKVRKNNVVTQLTDCCPSHETMENKNPSLLLKTSGCGLTEGDGVDQNNSASDLENLSDGEDQDSLPLLIRSMSCSRRHSWEGPLSPTALGDVRRRLSLDVLGIDSDGEGEREDEDQLDQSGYELTEPLNANPVSRESDRQAPRGQGQANSSMSEDEITEQVKEGTKMRPRLETYLSKGAEGRSLAQCRESEPETSLEIHEEKENLEPNHLLVQQVLQELKAFHGHCNGSATSARTGSGSGALSGSNSPHDLTWMEFLAEKEGDGKSERPEKETKVKRTLSSLKNRVTGSFKDKAKTKEKEKESPKEKRKCNNGHCLVPGSFSSSTSCTLCSKPLSGKTSYQCMNCAVNVHKNCRMLLAECTTPKSKQKDSQQKYSGNPQNTAQPAPLVKEQPRCLPLATDGTSGAVRSIGMTVPPRRPSQPSSTSVTSYTNHGITAGEMEQEVENGIPKTKTSAEETQGLISSSIESLVAEDTIYASLKAELEADGQDFEAESWSLAVDQAYAKKQSKEVIKRQDVIYELMQTEMHHLRTLKIMLHVYNRGMKEELQPSDRHLVGKIFPCLHQLLEIHGVFFSRLKERRKDSLEEGSDRNYLIQKIGDVLSQQFSGEYGEEMKVQYGNFCGQHNEAVNYYKEMYQQSKKFQNLIKKLSNYAVVRRLGVQECILLVTQRITKYPVLVERIIQNTEAGSEDHDELTKALLLIKDTISDVDERVSVCEKARRLKEIANRMEPKSIAKLKNGDAFRKVDMLRSKRRLLYEGVVCWKAASGRLKDILALVLTDVILLLQEKDQKYSFATVDQKPAGISLQKLIVREVANEEKGMFLISASDEGPEMYEIHTNSKEERNTWMAVIRDAINRFPIEEAALNEDQQQDEKKAAQIKELQQRLGGKDEELKRTLSEKLEIFSEIAEIHGYTDAGRPRLLLRADALESQRDSTLNDALKEVENLQNLIAAQPINVSWQLDDTLGSSALPRRAETFGGYDSSSANPSKDGSIKRKSNTLSSSSELKVKEKAGSRASSEPQLQDVCSDGESGRASDLPRWYTISTCSFLHDAEFVQSVQTLTSQLYKLKVLIAQCDSYIETQRYTGASGERDRQSRLLASRGSLLLEQEKQRNVEKQREEWANVQKLQNQVRQEQQKWERDRERQKRELDIQEARLQDHEKSLQQLMERLAQDKEELERHRQEYQQDLERLRESQRTVEKDRERLEQRQRKQLKHNTVLFPTETGQIPGFPHMDGDRMEVNPMLLNEGGMAQQSLKYQGQQSMVVELGERPADSQLQRENSTASMFARTENRSSLIPKTEVPIHLVSATNQILKHTGVQQKIPTKLATLKGGKEKSGKGKDRQSSVSGTASFSTPHGTGSNNPVKFLTKDDGTLRGRRSSSPVISSSQGFSQQESSVPVDIQHEPQQALSTSLTSGNPQPQSAPIATVTQQPAPQRVQDESGTEIIFF